MSTYLPKSIFLAPAGTDLGVKLLSLDFPLSVEVILYDEDERPDLFAYFVQGGCGQVLDNAHGNVYFGVANGNACTMHSLAWDDPEDKTDAHNAIRASTPGQVID